MQTEIGIVLAFGAGLVSFLSPCVLPLVPSYLSFVTGVSYQELLDREGSRSRILVQTLLFVSGFSAVFVGLGFLISGPRLLFSGLGSWIDIAAGSVVLAFGAHLALDLFAGLNRERRIQLRSRPTGAGGSVLIGMAFGAGWSPCIGPILASVLLMAGTGANQGRAVILLASYSLGLGTPFILAGLFFSRIVPVLHHLRRHLGTIRRASGVFLMGMGLLILFGRFQQLNAWLQIAGTAVYEWGQTDPDRSRTALGLVFIAIGLLPLGIRTVRTGKPISMRSYASASTTTLSLLLMAVGVGSMAGAIDLPRILSAWLWFQGI